MTEVEKTKNKNSNKILIATGIFPPHIGGPAQYAKNLNEVLLRKGYRVSIGTYTIEYKLPVGIRHLYFFLKIIPKIITSDKIIIFDTYSVGFPTVMACKIFGRKSVVRLGGDVLWEQYVERTGKKVLLQNFYQTEFGNLTFKEKIIYNLTKWTLSNVSHIVFSTTWQRDIFMKPYSLRQEKISIIENFYGPKESSQIPTTQLFVASTRNLVWKNLDVLKGVFKNIQEKNPDVKLFTENLPFGLFMEKIRKSYAVILVSLGDISPNMILDAIRYNKPFICTKEVGIYERIKDIGIFVDPMEESQIQEAVESLLDPLEYKKAEEKVRAFQFTHTWDEIADEFLKIFT